MSFDSDNYAFRVKEKFGKAKRLIDRAMLACVILSMVYFIYWGLVVNDSYIYELSARYFMPLANLLTDGTGLEIYRQCAAKLLGSVAVLYALYFYCDKKEENLISKHYEIVDLKEKKRKIQQKAQKAKETKKSNKILYK